MNNHDSNISSTCSHNMVNFGPLPAETSLPVSGTLSIFNGFRVLASLLQRCHLPEANQTLHNLWSSLGLLHYIYIFGGSCPSWNFAWYRIDFMSKCCVLLYWQHYCTALQQRAFAKLCGVIQGMELLNFRRGRHLYSAR